MYQFQEKDWKWFRKKLPEWQEAYMERLTQEYIRLLSGEENASDRFWELEKRINRDKKCVGVVANMRRSMMVNNLVALVADEVIRPEDMDGFCDDLVKVVKAMAKPIQ